MYTPVIHSTVRSYAHYSFSWACVNAFQALDRSYYLFATAVRNDIIDLFVLFITNLYQITNKKRAELCSSGEVIRLILSPSYGFL